MKALRFGDMFIEFLPKQECTCEKCNCNETTEDLIEDINNTIDYLQGGLQYLKDRLDELLVE